MGLNGFMSPWIAGATFTTSGLPISVMDGSSNTIYGRAFDMAGNMSACSSASIVYVDSSPVSLPPCDIVLSEDMTFKEFQLRLDSMQSDRTLYDADGAVVVCLQNGVTISTASSEQGNCISIPGNDFLLSAPSGTAYVRNSRTDANPSANQAQGGLYVTGKTNFSAYGLSIETQGTSGSGLTIENSTVPFLRNLHIQANAVSELP